MAISKKAKLIVIVTGICLAILLILLTILFFYLLSYIISTPGSVILFIVFLWLTLRLAVKILVFPGSCWFWKRSIEAAFCIELSNQIYYKIRDLRNYLQAIQNQERVNYQSNCPMILESILERYGSFMSYRKLNKRQLRLFDYIGSIKKLLQETTVIIDSNYSKNMWEWLQERLYSPEPSDIVYEDYPDCHFAKKLISTCIETEKSLLKSCGSAKKAEKISRWLFDDTLGNIHYLREDLLMRFKAEQIWINCDKIKLDW